MQFVAEGLAVATPPAPVDMASLARAAVKQALAELGAVPNMAFVFVAADNAEDLEQGLRTVREAVPSATTVGVSATGVLAAARASESGTAVAVWLANIPELRVRAFHLEVMADGDGHHVVGLPGRRRDDVLAIVLTDPWSFPTTDFVDAAEELLHGLPVVGAIGGSAQHGLTRLLSDDQVHSSGAVGVILGGQCEIVTAVSPACRPVGPVLTVTDSEGFLLRSLAGTPAVLRAQEVVASLAEPERSLALQGLCIGVAVNHVAEDPRTGDFVIHDVHHAEGERGALQMATPVPVGASVQFHVRDEAAAEEDLAVVLEGMSARMADRLAGALLFTSATRGRSMFGTPDHDSALARDRLAVPVAGFFAEGEIAPLQGRTRVNRQTATVVGLGVGARAVPGHSEAIRPRRLVDSDAVEGEVHKFLAELSGPHDEDEV